MTQSIRKYDESPDFESPVFQRKFELLPDTHPEYPNLRRIRYLRNIPLHSIRSGDLGGWLEKEENLSHEGDCVVLEEAMVYQDARIYGKAVVYQKARIYGSATIHENACVFGEARIYEHAKVSGSAEVWDRSNIHGESYISGTARVYEKADVSGSTYIYGTARIHGRAHISGKAHIFGSAEVRDNALISIPKDIVWFSNVGSERGTLTAFRVSGGGIWITRGCFSGTLDEFLQASLKKHGEDSWYHQEYSILAKAILHRFNQAIDLPKESPSSSNVTS